MSRIEWRQSTLYCNAVAPFFFSYFFFDDALSKCVFCTKRAIAASESRKKTRRRKTEVYRWKWNPVSVWHTMMRYDLCQMGLELMKTWKTFQCPNVTHFICVSSLLYFLFSIKSNEINSTSRPHTPTPQRFVDILELWCGSKPRLFFIFSKQYFI